MTRATHGHRRGAGARPPGGRGHWLQVSLEVWLLIAPIVEQVQVIAAPPKLVLWKWTFEAQPCADCDDETLSFQPLGMLADLKLPRGYTSINMLLRDDSYRESPELDVLTEGLRMAGFPE